MNHLPYFGAAQRVADAGLADVSPYDGPGYGGSDAAAAPIAIVAAATDRGKDE